MSLRMGTVLAKHRHELRSEPIGKRIRARLGDVTVLDTTHAVLVWEPRRIICDYAVPPADLAAELVAASAPAGVPPAPEHGPLFPSVPFAVHTTDGEVLDVRCGDRTLAGAAFRPADPDLRQLVLLDFHAFDEWRHEDELNIGHPRDPFHRIDTFPSSRRVQVRSGSTVLAESTRPVVLFETGFPPRFYLPRADVRTDLVATDTSTVCPYKGWASYWSADVDGRRIDDVAWGYLDPLSDSERIGGLVCFDDTKVELVVDPS